MTDPAGPHDPGPDAPGPRIALRASDADRERVVQRLRVHASEGRLDVNELEERLAAAFSARTHGELEPLLADLPADRRPGRRHPAHRGAALRPWLSLCALFIVIWALTGAGYFWPVWPMLGTFVGIVGPGRGSGAHRCHAHRGHAGRPAPPAGI